MKFILTVHLVGAQLQIESERLDDLAGGYVAVNRLATSGVLPPGYPGIEVMQGVDAGVVRPATETAAEETRGVEPASTPQPEIPPVRETEQPGKPRKARGQAAAAAAAAAAAEPPATEKPVTRADATAALRSLMEDKGEPAVKKVLEALGVARFGLYVREEGQYQPVLDAIAKVGAA